MAADAGVFSFGFPLLRFDGGPALERPDPRRHPVGQRRRVVAGGGRRRQLQVREACPPAPSGQTRLATRCRRHPVGLHAMCAAAQGPGRARTDIAAGLRSRRRRSRPRHQNHSGTAEAADRGRRVAQHLRHHLDRHPVGQHEACRRVPQLVNGCAGARPRRSCRRLKHAGPQRPGSCRQLRCSRDQLLRHPRLAHSRCDTQDKDQGLHHLPGHHPVGCHHRRCDGAGAGTGPSSSPATSASSAGTPVRGLLEIPKLGVVARSRPPGWGGSRRLARPAMRR